MTTDTGPNALHEYSAPLTELPLELPTLDANPQGSRFDTSPAWELELLVSAAIVVGLFSLPGLIEHFFARIEPHATQTALVPLTMLHIYLMSAGYALLVAFTIHFSARAYWVGLIGLNSVFPQGLRWDRMTTGPAVTGVYRKRLSSPRRSIERLDNFCSITFSFAFMIVIVLVFTILLMGTAGAVGWSLSHLFLGGRNTPALVEAFVVAYLLFAIGTIQLDKRLGSRLAPGGRGQRLLARAATIVFYITPTAITGPILLTLTSNLGRRRMILTFQLAIFTVLALGGIDRYARSGRVTVNGYAYFTSKSPRSEDYWHYADQRPSGDRYTGLAWIQSATVTGPYIELFVPYVPSRDNDAVPARCPGMTPLAHTGVHLGPGHVVAEAAASSVLGCLATMNPVTLDGQPMQPNYDFYEDPATGLRGMLAHIPASALAAGRHLLVVTAQPAAGDSTPATPQFIPFWR